jgi:phage terminase large subunit-like protein
VLVDVAGKPRMAQACLPWAFDLPRALFGAYDPDSGVRHIRWFFEFVAKKNSKSTRAAGIMITALLRNWRDSGEFYILAPTKEIANNSFVPARDMVRADPELMALLQIQENQRTITHRTTRAFPKVVAADSETVSGKKTIGLLVDELWLFGPRAGAEAMLREAEGGLISRPEGFVIYLSTQSDAKPTGTFDQKLERFRDIRDGKLLDPLSLPILHEFPKAMLKSGEYRRPENHYITNPNIGKSVDAGFILHQLAEAERAGKASLIFAEAKLLNVQAGISMRADGWAGALIWSMGLEVGLTLDELFSRSEVVTIGIDGGGLDDLLGIAVIGREKETKRWLGWVHRMISTIGVVRRKANAEDYLKFKQVGDLAVFRFRNPAPDEIGQVPGEDDPALAMLLDGVPDADPDRKAIPADIRFIAGLVRRVQALGLLAQVGVDAAGIGAIVDALADIGVTQDAETLDSVRQGVGLMAAVKTIERKVADGSFRHGGQPLLDWCVGNLKVAPMATGMRVARDESGFGKVDPAMALFNAAHLMSLNPEAVARSGWNTDDLDDLMARIDAAVDAMTEMGDPESGRQVLHGIGTPA